MKRKAGSLSSLWRGPLVVRSTHIGRGEVEHRQAPLPLLSGATAKRGVACPGNEGGGDTYVRTPPATPCAGRPAIPRDQAPSRRLPPPLPLPLPTALQAIASVPSLRRQTAFQITENNQVPESAVPNVLVTSQKYASCVSRRGKTS